MLDVLLHDGSDVLVHIVDLALEIVEQLQQLGRLGLDERELLLDRHLALRGLDLLDLNAIVATQAQQLVGRSVDRYVQHVPGCLRVHVLFERASDRDHRHRDQSRCRSFSQPAHARVLDTNLASGFVFLVFARYITRKIIILSEICLS